MAKPKKAKAAKKEEETASSAEREEGATEPETEPAIEPEVAESDDEDGAESGPSVDVIKGEREYVRTYSKADHGKEFKALAEQFATKELYSKRGYRVVSGSEVIAVEVYYREKEDAEKHIDEQKPDAPMVDRRKRFTDKAEALRFNITKNGSILAVFAPKKK
jgi:hypothetical protein